MTDTAETSEGIAITVDGQPVLARPGELLIDACERNGVYIPRFCHHPRMKPVGMCRMCLVEVDAGRGPALQPSCMLTCSPDMVVETESDVTTKAQDGVLEFLLINHPLDCPVCDKGGECPLQDQTMAYGPGESRFVEEKRHFEKPIPINHNVFLDRERCILCDRCTRFAKDVAGDPLIHFQGRGNDTEVNTFPDEPFASYFSGNTVQICPVGALTARPYRFKARPWDLEEVESTATIDSVGSRIVVQSSRNHVLRYLGVDSDAVNWGWLSDRERFSFEALDSDVRLTEPLAAGGDEHQVTSWGAALTTAADAIRAATPERIAAIGGARLTNEAQYAWAKLLKGVIGTDHVDAQLGDGLPGELVLSLPRATIDDACRPGGTIVLCGPDPKELLGSLYLRLRHALVEDGATLIELTPRSTGLSRHATHSLHPRPGELGALARAVVTGSDADVAGVAGDTIAAAHRTLTSGAPVTVILGRSSAAESAALAAEAADAFLGLDGVSFLPALTRGNVFGALDMGLGPGLLPGRQRLGTDMGPWPATPSQPGLDAAGILAAAADGGIDVLVLLGADPLRDFPDRDLAQRALSRIATIVAVDVLPTDSVAAAHVVLPAATTTEVPGTFTNLEGRLSALAQKVTPPGTARADWIIAAELAARLGEDLGVESLDDIWAELATVSPVHAGIDPAAAVGLEGTVVTGTLERTAAERLETPSVDAYALRLISTREMYDQGTALGACPSSAGLHRSPSVALNPVDFEKLGVAPGDVVAVTSARTVLRLPARSDAGVPRGCAALVSHLDLTDAYDLIDVTSPVTDVRVERIS
ncbi:MAG: NADH-quinone oxidoreductase subunit NuoG [Acidimicrobiia bacterium]|nr:NADH-quinone oxidoreductase subunit NuoG [Acidimicrobiia bacterium]